VYTGNDPVGVDEVEPLHFYLGCHQPSWLWSEQVWPEPAGWWQRTGAVPMFVSHRRLAGYKTLRPSRVQWALDSGGFTELQRYGRWRTGPEEYVAAVARYDREIGGLDWAAPQDWMCEPAVISGGRAGPLTFAGTHLSVAEHQARTVENFLELRGLWPQFSDSSCPFMPVLQGYRVAEYVACAQLYREAGVDLFDPDVLDPGGEGCGLVGVGSVCRRQDTNEIGQVFRELDALGLPLHGFGVKGAGLARYSRHLVSADSMAWSRTGRNHVGCRADHKTEANCVAYALRWRAGVLAAAGAEVSQEHIGAVA
jgi:hypothetical protein